MTRTTPLRGEVLRDVIAAADARRDGVLPMDVPGVAETFATEPVLLGALQLRWHTRLAGAIERALQAQPLDLEAAVVGAWHETARAMPGVRRVIDRRTEGGPGALAGSALGKALAKEHELLAVAAGLGSGADEAALRAGAELADRARASYVETPPGPARRRPLTLVDRLKAALAVA